MLRATTICTEPGCGQATVRGTRWCEKHQEDNSAIVAARESKRRNYERRPYHKLYGRAQWANMRLLVFHRFPICTDCQREAATEVHHIKKHEGNPELFYSIENCTGLCKSCHDARTGRGE